MRFQTLINRSSELEADPREPVRMCLACRRRTGKKNLLRLVKSPAGRLIFDQEGKEQARGYYLCRNEECLSKFTGNRKERLKLEEGIFEQLVSYLLADK